VGERGVVEPLTLFWVRQWSLVRSAHMSEKVQFPVNHSLIIYTQLYSTSNGRY